MVGRARVSVVVPWAPGCEHRERARRWVVSHLIAAHPSWEVVHGVGGDPWCKAAAIANGLQIASGEILVIHDADVYVDPATLSAAVELIPTQPWVMPHLNVCRLSETGTARVYAGEDPATIDDYDQPPYHGWVGGGVIVVLRADYEAVPMDHRFVGWGLEDGSWGLAAELLIGPHHRLPAPLYHLWHPPQDRINRRVGNPQSEQLWWRYKQARHRPQRMRRLVDEGRP